MQPQIAQSHWGAILLAPNGSLWRWAEIPGADEHAPRKGRPPRKLNPPELLNPDTDWVKVSGMGSFALAQSRDGSLWMIGLNPRWRLVGEQKYRPTSTRAPIRIGKSTNWLDCAAGVAHWIAIQRDGSIWGWGQNGEGEVGDGTTRNRLLPIQITQDTNWTTIAVGGFNSYALKRDGTVWGWGAGNGINHHDLLPRQLDPSADWVGIFPGQFHLIALKGDGTLWLRGQNAHIVGSGFTKKPSDRFVQIGADNDWTEVSSRSDGFFARKTDGSWWVCGQDWQGELGFRTRPPDTGPMNIPAPVRLRLPFEPWVLSMGIGTTLVIDKTGTAWSLGQRFGTRNDNPVLPKWQQRINRTVSALPGKPRLFKTYDSIIDYSPHPLWDLPEELKQ